MSWTARSEQGFTLIEVLMIIIVLGLLAAIVVFSIGQSRRGAAVASCRTAFSSVQLSAEAYSTRIGHYPDAEADVVGPDGMLKSWPTSDVYTIAYNPVGYSAGPPVIHATGFILIVQDEAGNTVASCNAL